MAFLYLSCMNCLNAHSVPDTAVNKTEWLKSVLLEVAKQVTNYDVHVQWQSM